MEYITFKNGVKMPRLGHGLWRVPGDNVQNVVASALQAGYRAFDTAMIYRNEKELGDALKLCSVPRDELFISSKLWNEYLRQGTEDECFQQSLKLVNVDYFDMYMIHWPVPGKYVHAWEYLIRQYEAGKIRVLGACNMHIHMLETLKKETGVLPMLLQVECNPLMSQKELLAYCKENGIVMQAYSPLMQGESLNESVIKEIADCHSRTPAQVILRWHLQNGICVIPRSQNPGRQKENIDVFDFELTADEMQTIDKLNQNKRLCADPDHFDF